MQKTENSSAKLFRALLLGLSLVLLSSQVVSKMMLKQEADISTPGTF